RALAKNVGDRVLKGSSDIGLVLTGKGFESLRGLANRCFQAGKGEVAARPSHHGARQGKAERVALPRGALHGGAAGIAKTEEFRHLVEGFAHRIVDGCAETTVVSYAFHHEKLAVAARYEQ